MARVMEFQYHEHIPIDGAVGPTTINHLRKKRKDEEAPKGRCVLVDLINERLTAYEDGNPTNQVPQIKGGPPSGKDASTRGVFRVYRREETHTSSEYPDPPGNMNFSLFFHVHTC